MYDYKHTVHTTFKQRILIKYQLTQSTYNIIAHTPIKRIKYLKINNSYNLKYNRTYIRIDVENTCLCHIPAQAHRQFQTSS